MPFVIHRMNGLHDERSQELLAFDLERFGTWINE